MISLIVCSSLPKAAHSAMNAGLPCLSPAGLQNRGPASMRHLIPGDAVAMRQQNTTGTFYGNNGFAGLRFITHVGVPQHRDLETVWTVPTIDSLCRLTIDDEGTAQCSQHDKGSGGGVSPPS